MNPADPIRQCILLDVTLPELPGLQPNPPFLCI